MLSILGICFVSKLEKKESLQVKMAVKINTSQTNKIWFISLLSQSPNPGQLAVDANSSLKSAGGICKEKASN